MKNLNILLVLLVACSFVAAKEIGQDEILPVDKSFNESNPMSNCGGNCPGGCSTCPCGTSTHYVNINDWCSQFSGWNQACCRCIVQHESGGNANAVNQNAGGSLDVGVWQINSVNWGSCSGGSPPCNPSTNLHCAEMVWKWGGNSFRLWSTCGACGCC